MGGCRLRHNKDLFFPIIEGKGKQKAEQRQLPVLPPDHLIFRHDKGWSAFDHLTGVKSNSHCIALFLNLGRVLKESGAKPLFIPYR
jgi:hypothetical protein